MRSTGTAGSRTTSAIRRPLSMSAWLMVLRSQRTLKPSSGATPARPPGAMHAPQQARELHLDLAPQPLARGLEQAVSPRRRAARKTSAISRLTAAGAPPGDRSWCGRRRARCRAACARTGSAGPCRSSAGPGPRSDAATRAPAALRNVPRSSALRASRPASTPSGGISPPGMRSDSAVASQARASCRKALASGASPPAAGARGRQARDRAAGRPRASAGMPAAACRGHARAAARAGGAAPRPRCGSRPDRSAAPARCARRSAERRAAARCSARRSRAAPVPAARRAGPPAAGRPAPAGPAGTPGSHRRGRTDGRGRTSCSASRRGEGKSRCRRQAPSAHRLALRVRRLAVEQAHELAAAGCARS